MKFSHVPFCALAFVQCIFVSPFKKNFIYIFFLFCSVFPASNSLQIFQLIPCKSLWDLTCLVSWGDKCFLCDELGYTDLLFSVQLNLSGTIKAYHSVPPISLQERHFATCSYILFDPAPFNDSCPLPASHSTCCFVLWLKDQTHARTNPEDPSWKLMSKGRERSHQKLYLYREFTSTLSYL